MITLIEWNDRAEAGLKISAMGDEEIIKDQVKRGIAQLWEVKDEDAEGYIVTRIERVTGGKELVFVLAEGRHVTKYIPFFVSACKELNISSIRAHISNDRLENLLFRKGFLKYQTVVRKEL